MPSKSELQNLLRKMGGTPESGDSVDETIKKISEVYEPGGGGSGLPEGGSAGQILKKKSSVEGDAEWAEDENDIFIMHLTSNASSNGYIIQEDYDDIMQAATNGKYIGVVCKDGSAYNHVYTSYFNNTTNKLYIHRVRIKEYGTSKSYESNKYEVTRDPNGNNTIARFFASEAPGFFNQEYMIKAPVTIRLLCDGEYTYKDSPDGTLSLEAPDYIGGNNHRDRTSSISALLKLIDVEAYYGDHVFNGICQIAYGDLPKSNGDYGDVNGAGKIEYYDLISIESVQENHDNYEDYKVTLVFRAISSRNNNVVIKTITISDYAFWGSGAINNIVPVYSEEVCGAGGGGGIFAVEFTGNDYTNSYQTPNKTFDEIYSAYQNGQIIIGIKGSDIYQLSYIRETYINFRLIASSDNLGKRCASIRSISWAKGDTQAVLYIYNNYQPGVLTIHLICNDDYSYRDSPSGTFSVDIEPYDLRDAIEAYCGRSNNYSDVVLAYGPEYDDWSQPAQSERYALAFADWSEVYNDAGDPIRNVSLTFRVLSIRGNTVVMKTVVVSGDAYSEAYGRDTPITVTYSEITLGGST